MAGTDGHPIDRWQQEKDEIFAYLPNLKAFARSLTSDYGRAEDLVQETYLRAVSNLDKFEKGSNLHAWLFTIMRNLFRTEWRKRKREVEDVENSYAKTFSVEPDVEAANELDKLCLSIACLPRDQSDMVMAVGYLGLDYHVTAEIFGCAVGTVKSRVNRARSKLTKLMADGVMVKVDVEHLKHATRSVPKGHPYYPIARAYEELFCEVRSVGVDDKVCPVQSTEEALWEELVKSGALDPDQDVPDFIEQGYR